MYELTKMDLAAIRQCDYMHVSLVAGESKVRACKRKERSEKEPFAEDAQIYLDIPVTSYTRFDATHSQTKMGTLLYHYPAETGRNHLASVLSLLRVGDKVGFQFYPDAHSTQNTREAGLHGDVLRLLIERGKQRLCFEVATSMCPENSARMCQGVPYTD